MKLHRYTYYSYGTVNLFIAFFDSYTYRCEISNGFQSICNRKICKYIKLSYMCWTVVEMERTWFDFVSQIIGRISWVVELREILGFNVNLFKLWGGGDFLVVPYVQFYMVKLLRKPWVSFQSCSNLGERLLSYSLLLKWRLWVWRSFSDSQLTLMVWRSL